MRPRGYARLCQCVALGFALQAVAVFGDVSEMPDFLEVEKSVLAHREQLRSGKLQINVSHWSARPGEPRAVSELRYDVTFDGESLRFDSRCTLPHIQGSTPLAVVTSKLVMKPNHWIYHSDDISADGRRQSVVMGIPELMNGVGVGAFDPLRLGIVPTNATVMHAFRNEDFLGNAERGKSRLEKGSLRSHEVWEVACERLDGVRTRFWIAPEMDYSVLAAETESIHPTEGIIVDRIENKMKRWPEGDVWFPEEVVFERMLAGVLVEHEDITVRNAAFNTAVESSVFTLAGLNVPPGTGILEHPPNPTSSREWNGESIVPLYRPSGILSEVPGTRREDSSGQSRIVLTVLVNAIMAALFLGAYMYYRNRNQKESSE